MKVKKYNSFEEFENDNISGDYEIFASVNNNGWSCNDLMTKCKSYKTALKRFYKGLLQVWSKADADAWYEAMFESAENGYFTLHENNEFHYEIECLYEGLYYIYLNVNSKNLD